MSNQFKPFFVHFNRPVTRRDNSRMMHTPRGFTAFVEPSNENRCVSMRIVYCSPKDQFSKKEGRKFVMEKPALLVNTRLVARILDDAVYECGYEKDHTYIYKYMVQ